MILQYLVILLLVICGIASAKAENMELIYTVSTLAGSGEMGAVDGSGPGASFKSQTGLPWIVHQASFMLRIPEIIKFAGSV